MQLKILAVVFGKVIEFFKWTFSGDDAKESKRSVLALLLVLSVLGNVKLMFSGKKITQELTNGAPVTVEVNGEPVTVKMKVTETKIEYVYVKADGTEEKKTEGKLPEDWVEVLPTGERKIHRWGISPKLGIGVAAAKDASKPVPVASIRAFRIGRFGVSAFGWATRNDSDEIEWGVGPSMDARLPVFNHVRVGIGYSYFGSGHAWTVPLTVDLR